MCAASHSCHAFRKADGKKVHAERKHADFVYWFLTGRMAPPAWGCLRRPRGMCAASHSWHAFRIVDDKTGHVERKNVDFVLVLYSQDGRARMGVLSAGIRRWWGYILIRNEDVGVGVGVCVCGSN